MQRVPWPSLFGSIQNVCTGDTRKCWSWVGKVSRGQPGSGVAGTVEGKAPPCPGPLRMQKGWGQGRRGSLGQGGLWDPAWGMVLVPEKRACTDPTRARVCGGESAACCCPCLKMDSVVVSGLKMLLPAKHFLRATWVPFSMIWGSASGPA